MKITNEKTGASYLSNVEQFNGVYYARVYKNDNEGSLSMVSFEKFDNYRKAYRYACKACKAHAANHAYLN